MTETSTSSNNACTYTRHFRFEILAFQTCQQSVFVDAEGHRRVDRGHGCSQVLERTLRHPRNMVPFGESLNRRPCFIVNSWRGWPDKPLITLRYIYISERRGRRLTLE
jgi:hypothetical protein